MGIKDVFLCLFCFEKFPMYQYILCPLPNPIRDMLVQTESQKKIHKSTKICHAVLATKVEKLKKINFAHFSYFLFFKHFQKVFPLSLKKGKKLRKNIGLFTEFIQKMQENTQFSQWNLKIECKKDLSNKGWV